MTAYFWAASNLKARAACCAVSANGLVVPAWSEPGTVFTFDGATVTPALTAMSSADEMTGRGSVGVACTSSGGTWTLSAAGLLSSYGTSFSLSASFTLAAAPYTGLASIGNTVYACSSAGVVWSSSGSAPVQVGTFGTMPRGLVTDGTDLYAALPLTSQLGIMVASSGAVSTVASPVPLPAFVAVKSGSVAVAGWSSAVLPAGTSYFAAAPGVSPTEAAICNAAAGSVTLLAGTDPDWTTGSSVSGMAGVSAVAWTTNSEQILAAAPGDFYVVSITAGALAIAQTLSATGVTAIGVVPDGSEALLAQTGANQIAVISQSVGTWSISSAISSVSAPVAILLTSSVEGFAIGGGGLITLQRNGAAWEVNATTPLTVGGTTVTGTGIVADAAGNLYVTATNGASGYLMVLSAAGTPLASTTWTGGAAGLVIVSEQVLVLDNTNALVRPFAHVGGALEPQATTAAPAGPTTITAGSISVVVAGASATGLYELGAPYALLPIREGMVGLYQSSAWTTYTLGVGHDPSAVAFDAAGALHVVTTQNDHYTFSTTGGIAQTGLVPVPVYSGQTAGTSLAMSSLTPWNGHLYATTSASGVIVEVA